MPDGPITMYKNGRTIQVSKDAMQEATRKGWNTTPETQFEKSQGQAGQAWRQATSAPDPMHMLGQAGTGLKQLGQGALEMGKGIAPFMVPAAGTIPGMSPLSWYKRNVDQPAAQQAQQASQLHSQGRNVEAAGHEAAGALPLFGPWAAGLGEQAGSGDVAGAAARGGATVAGAELAGRAIKSQGPTARMAKENAALESTTKLGRAESGKVGMDAAKVRTQPLRDMANEQISQIDEQMASQNVNVQALNQYTKRAIRIADQIQRSPSAKQIDVSAAKDVVDRLDARLKDGKPMTWPEARKFEAEINNAMGGLKGASMLREVMSTLKKNLGAALEQSAQASGLSDAYGQWSKNYKALSAYERGYGKIVSRQTPGQLEAKASARPPLLSVKGIGIGGGSKAGKIAAGEIKGAELGYKALERNMKNLKIPQKQSGGGASAPSGGSMPQLQQLIKMLQKFNKDQQGTATVGGGGMANATDYAGHQAAYEQAKAQWQEAHPGKDPVSGISEILMLAEQLRRGGGHK